MSVIDLVHMGILALFGGLLVWAAYTDISKYIIPNTISLALLALYPFYVMTAPMQIAWVLALIIAGIVFIAGFFMFAFGVMGGGDVKLMTAALLWVGPQYMMPFFGTTLIAALVLAVVIAARMAFNMERENNPTGGMSAGPDGTAAARRMLSCKWILNLRYIPLTKLNVPYGAALAVGGLTFLGLTVFNA